MPHLELLHAQVLADAPAQLVDYVETGPTGGFVDQEVGTLPEREGEAGMRGKHRKKIRLGCGPAGQ